MAKKTDQQTLDLINEVNRRKKEISKLEKPNWCTNCSFGYTEGSATGRVNIQVESNIRNLINMAAFLREKERSYLLAADAMSIENPPPFTWDGFGVCDWIEDIKTRINKIQINSKKQKLEQLEMRLSSIISPELRAQMELEAIAKEMKDGFAVCDEEGNVEK